MSYKLAMLSLCGSLAFSIATADSSHESIPEPGYTDDARLTYPRNYREWIFLTAGLDMSYTQGMTADHHMFDNVFVEPHAYREFVATGSWPDKTMLVKEVRGAKTKGSINQSGHFQSTDLMEIEIHVKDIKRFPGQWGFFAFAGDAPATLIPAQAECYACHGAHGGVDTTFVQFYPTLSPIAATKGTLRRE